MNYWHMNLHPTDEQGTDNDIRNRVLTRTIGMGIDFDLSKQGHAFRSEMNIGDIVLILNGRTPIALVEIIGDWFESTLDTNQIVWYGVRRCVKILCISGIEDSNCFTNLPMIPKTRAGTLGISSTKNCDTYKYIHALYECCKNKA